MGVAEVVGTSSRLDAVYWAVRQDKGGRLTRPWKGGVVEAASRWTGATPKGDLYAGDAVNLYAKDLFATVDATLEGGTGLVLCRCKLWFDQRSVRHEGGRESRARRHRAPIPPHRLL